MATATKTKVLTPITQRHVDVYCRRARALNVSKKTQEKLREDLLAWMVAGNSLPNEGPWTIELSQNGGKEPIAWKDEYLSLYARFLRIQNEYTKPESLALAQAHVTEMEKEQPDKEKVIVLGEEYVGGVKFNTKANPGYRTKTVVVTP